MSSIERQAVVEGSVLFTSDELARLLEISGQDLRDWVADGLIVPVVKGGRRRHGSHHFSCVQALGMAMVAAMRRSAVGCKPAGIRAIVRAYEGLVGEELAAYLESLIPITEDNDYRKEERVAYIQRYGWRTPQGLLDIWGTEVVDEARQLQYRIKLAYQAKPEGRKEQPSIRTKRTSARMGVNR
jgi:hypothetical protein